MSEGESAVDLDARAETPPPCEPAPADCCGQGCVPCVFDIYDQEVKIWKNSRLKRKNVNSNPGLNEESYTSFAIEDIIEEKGSVYRYRFSLDGQQLGHKPGQHVIVREMTEGRRQVVTRQYSLLSAPLNVSYFDLLIKLYPEGLMSGIIRQKWKIGSMVEMRGPCGQLDYRPNGQAAVVMLCAGTGLVPIVSVVGAILDNESDETLIRLLYSCPGPDSALLDDELAEFSCYWNFSLRYYFSGRPGDHSGWLFRKDYVWERLGRRLLADELGRLKKPEETLFLVCGSKDYIRQVSDHLLQLGVNQDRVVKF